MFHFLVARRRSASLPLRRTRGLFSFVLVLFFYPTSSAGSRLGRNIFQACVTSAASGDAFPARPSIIGGPNPHPTIVTVVMREIEISEETMARSIILLVGDCLYDVFL